MNNKGFTIIEIISIISILALLIVITTPLITNTSENIKKSALKTKIQSLEKAAILYGQEYKENFVSCTSDDYCEGIDNCYCFNKMVTIEELINKKFIKTEENEKIINPLNDQPLEGCRIKIYQKYGKIYSIYDKEYDIEKCWYLES